MVLLKLIPIGYYSTQNLKETIIKEKWLIEGHL